MTDNDRLRVQRDFSHLLVSSSGFRPHRPQEREQRRDTAFRVIDINLVPAAFDHRDTRAGNRVADHYLLGQWREWTTGRSQHQGWYFDLGQERGDVHTWHQ